MQKISKSTFIVFDLDDTLYKENSYHESGLMAVSAQVKTLYGVDYAEALTSWKKDGEKDLFGRLCRELKLPPSVKESFVWIYRLHTPSVILNDQITELLDYLVTCTAGVAILTDGRSVSQRLKLSALGLSSVPVYISEEWESEKPSKLRFSEIMSRHDASSYAYIGDNPKKDFKAPNCMGWLTIGLKGDKSNIHSQSINGLSDSYTPSIWLDELQQVRELIC